MIEAAAPAEKPVAVSDRRQTRAAFLLMIGLFGAFVAAQLAGLEVVGGDPDRFFRPLKSELVRSLKAGKLPLWSERFGFGMPLAAESEVGAFYPPHWLIYAAFGASHGYRISQCLHQCMAIAFLFVLACRLGALPLGAAMGAMIFVLGGFPSIQASKEWAILGMAWMPAAFLGTEIWFENGWNRNGRRGLALLSIALACLALIGHFQMAQLTCLGLAIWVSARSLVESALLRRWPGLVLAIAIATAIASPQLALSWRYANEVGATDRTLATLSYYSYPLECLTELAIPLWTRRVAGGPEGAFWTLRNTTRFEAAMFVGSAGLMMALIGLSARNDWAKRALPMLALIFAGFGIATMPQWSMETYAAVIELPGMGLFRCPGRYAVMAHLGLALAAARGWGRWPNAGSLAAILGTFGGSAWYLKNFLNKPLTAPGMGMKLPVLDRPSPIAGFPDWPTFGLALVSFFLAAMLIVLSKNRPKLRLLIFLASTAELTGFYFAGPTRWGWSLGLPESSRLMSHLAEAAKTAPVVVMSPYLDNMPVSGGVTTLSAYFGVAMPPPNNYLRDSSEGLLNKDRIGSDNFAEEYLGRIGASHIVRVKQVGDSTAFPDDPIAAAGQGASLKPRTLYLKKLDPPTGFGPPWCWTAETIAEPRDGPYEAFGRMVGKPRSVPFTSDADIGPYRKSLNDLDPNAIVTFDESRCRLDVRHTGTALVILKRTFDDGWHAIDEATGKEFPILPVFGGIQAIVVSAGNEAADSKETVIRLHYRPASLTYTVPASLASLIGVILLAFARRNRAVPERTGAISDSK